MPLFLCKIFNSRKLSLKEIKKNKKTKNKNESCLVSIKFFMDTKCDGMHPVS